MLIHCIILILTSFLSRASSNYDDGREGNSTGLIFSKIELYKINSWSETLEQLLSWGSGWKENRWQRFQVARRNWHDSITGHLRKGDSLNYSLKRQKELLLIQRSLKLSKPAQGKSKTIIWRSSEKWHTQIGKETMVMEQLGKRKAHSRWYRGYNLVSERVLKNLIISIFIKVCQHPCQDPSAISYYHDE